jgi:hypothetical protein
MRKCRFTEEQIAGVLKESESGIATTELRVGNELALPLECVCIMRVRPCFSRKLWAAKPVGALPPHPQDLALWCLSR